MALSIVNNAAALAAQANLNSTSNSLNTSLQRLSSGLKINSGADGPAGLVVSQEQQAQIAGLNSAIQNTSVAVASVQTGDNALNQMSSLLTNMKLLAQDNANGDGGAVALTANQSIIGNAIGTINTLINTTAYGQTTLFAPATATPAASGAPGMDAIETQMAAFGAKASQDMTTLAKTDFANPTEAGDAVAVIDQEISAVSGLTGALGTFQVNTLQANASNLSAALQNTTAAQSVVQSTDFASETANFTQLQVQLQAGANVLASASQSSQLILKLLQQ